MKGDELINSIDQVIPPSLALPGDRIGYIGEKDPSLLDVTRVLVQLDYLPESVQSNIVYQKFDLLILHHPPLTPPPMPTYVIHSNWDRVKGGACSALAESLDLNVEDILDYGTMLGMIGTLRSGPLPISRFLRYAMRSLGVDNLRVVNYSGQKTIQRIGIVPGFGLNPDMIRIAAGRNLDLYLSGDLTHQGAVMARGNGLFLVDASHYATELPGLRKLGEVIAGIGLSVTVHDTGVPEGIVSDYYRPISYRGINSYQRFPFRPHH